MAKQSNGDRSPGGIVRTALVFLAASWLVAAASIGVAGAGDTNPPNVWVTSPGAGQVVSATTTLAARAPGAVAVTWFVDGSAVASDSTRGWTQPWDSSAVPDGTHRIYATAVDAAGQTGTSTTVSFTVLNGSTSAPPPTAPSATTPCGTTSSPPARWEHVVWIVMENKAYSQVIGSSNAPYINAVADKCGSATNFHAATHPSLPNYIAMTSGSTQGITDDNAPSAHPLNVPSIFSQLASRWAALQESMTTNCQQTSSGTYAVKHNPAAYYTNIRLACATQDVPLGSTPDVSAAFTFITPNLCNDMHDCTVTAGDTWLSTELPKILDSSQYAAGTTAVFLTWDEDDSSASNQVPTLVVAPSTALGTLSGSAFSHYSMLRTTEEMLGQGLLGNAATALSMRSAFNL